MELHKIRTTSWHDLGECCGWSGLGSVGTEGSVGFVGSRLLKRAAHTLAGEGGEVRMKKPRFARTRFPDSLL